jgi:hypothetical protein
MRSLELSRKKNADLFKDSYKSPAKKQQDLTASVRHAKVIESPLRESLKRQYLFENPTASKERADGAAWRLAKEYKLEQVRKKDIDPQVYTFHPKLTSSPTQSSGAKLKEYVHTGIFTSCKGFDGEQIAWTCCLKNERSSKVRSYFDS